MVDEVVLDVLVDELLDEELLDEELDEEVLVDVLVELVTGGAVLAVDVLVLLDVEEDVDVLVDASGHVQSLWQTSAPVGLPGKAPHGLPGGSHSSPGSMMPLPQVTTAVLEVVELVLVVVLELEVVTVDDVTVVEVVVVAQLPQQSRCPVSTVPPSSRQCSAERSMSHFGGLGQSRKLVQNAPVPTHRDFRTSQKPKRGSEHTTALRRPQVDSSAQSSMKSMQRRGMTPRRASFLATRSTQSS